MRKSLVFFLGVMTGVILTIATYMIVGPYANKKSKLVLFDEPGDVVDVNSLEVLQVLDKGMALAQDSFLTVYLLYDADGKEYYDNQTVAKSEGACFAQIGTFKRYNNGEPKTFPAVSLVDCKRQSASLRKELFSDLEGEVRMFDEPGEVLSNKSFKVTSVLKDGLAKAVGKDHIGYYYGLEVVLFDTTKVFYDDQIVKLPNGKRFRQVGTYKVYSHTYPIVSPMK